MNKNAFLPLYILKHILLRLGAITPVFGDPSEIILICWFDAQEIFNINYYQWQLFMLLNVVVDTVIQFSQDSLKK